MAAKIVAMRAGNSGGVELREVDPEELPALRAAANEALMNGREEEYQRLMDRHNELLVVLSPPVFRDEPNEPPVRRVEV